MTGPQQQLSAVLHCPKFSAVRLPAQRAVPRLAMPPKKAKGAKAKKQQGGKAKSRGAGNRRNNPKAFAAASGTKAQAKNAYRTLEKQERKYHISLTDRSVDVEVRSPSLRPSALPRPLHVVQPCRVRSRRRLSSPLSAHRAWARAL